MCAALLGTGAATLATAPAAAAAERPLVVGAQFKGMWSDYTDAQRNAVLDRLAAAGMTSVRLDVSWAMVEPNGPGQYDPWGVGFVDKVIAMINARGMKPLVTLWMCPGWANSNRGDRYLPNNPSDFGRIANWFAKRYDGKVAGWEVWNEPNLDYFMRGADPVAYTRLLKAAYVGFKAGSPGTPVLFGGTADVDTGWIGRAYAAGAAGSFDVMAVHPYMGVADEAPELPDNGTQWRLDHVRALQRLMASYGDGAKKIWFTEMGWSSHPTAPGAPNWERGVTEAVQADFSVRAIKWIRAQYPYVSNMYFYTERNLVNSHIQDNNYGLMYHDLRPKPVYNAIRNHLADSPSTPTMGSEPVAAPRTVPIVTPVATPVATSTPTATTAPAPTVTATPTPTPVVRPRIRYSRLSTSRTTAFVRLRTWTFAQQVYALRSATIAPVSG